MLLGICLIFCQFQPGLDYKSVDWKKACTMKVLPVQIDSFLTSCFLDSLSASSLNSWDMCGSQPVALCTNEFPYKMYFTIHFNWLYTPHFIDTWHGKLLIYLSIWIRILNSFLHRAFKPNLTAFGSKILMFCWLFFCCKLSTCFILS